MDTWNLTSDELGYTMSVARRAANKLIKTEKNLSQEHWEYWFDIHYQSCYQRALKWVLEAKKHGVRFMPEPQGWGHGPP